MSWEWELVVSKLVFAFNAGSNKSQVNLDLRGKIPQVATFI